MDITGITLFSQVARLGSFAAAAKANDVDPSRVSRAIAALEARLGVRLFERTTRSLTLTEAGEVYLSQAGPLAEELLDVSDQVRGLRAKPTGTLRLTASVAFGQECIVPLLAELTTQYPELDVECLFTDTNVDLISDRIDLAVRLAPTVSGDLVVTKLMDTAYKVVASPAYLERTALLIQPSDLQSHNCILFNLPEYRNAWSFQGSDGTQTTLPIVGSIVLSPAGAVRDACVAGLGPALLADWLVDKAIEAGTLVDCFPLWKVTATTFETAAWLVYPSRRYLPIKTRVVIDFFKKKFRCL
ncbi:MAG: LysR family transcriptional regulator [Ahrensia sp.]|nr:LysR family transcriptional regulator [Ahrensia sp.]